jgi:preprotein translocase subunit SecG
VWREGGDERDEGLSLFEYPFSFPLSFFLSVMMEQEERTNSIDWMRKSNSSSHNFFFRCVLANCLKAFSFIAFVLFFVVPLSLSLSSFVLCPPNHDHDVVTNSTSKALVTYSFLIMLT